MFRYSDGNKIRLYTAIGETIRKRREEAGASRTKLAARIGVSDAMLDRIEEGITPCPIHVLVRLADAFDCSLDSLVPVLTDEAAA
jgi:transcriptional regulator with XRE-family HTH domain